MFCTDIADYIYSNPGLLDLNLKGFWISDRKRPSFASVPANRTNVGIAEISWLVVQEQIPAVDFVHKYLNVFSLKCAPRSMFRSEMLTPFDCP